MHNRSASEILKELHSVSDDAKHPDLSRLMKCLASFHYSLSQEASNTSDKNLRIANRAFQVSICALVIAILQFITPLFRNEQAKSKTTPRYISHECQSAMPNPTIPMEDDDLATPPIRVHKDEPKNSNAPDSKLIPTP